MDAREHPEQIALAVAKADGLVPGVAMTWKFLAARRGQTRGRVVTGWREIGDWVLLEACDRSRRRFGWPVLDLSASEDTGA